MSRMQWVSEAVNSTIVAIVRCTLFIQNSRNEMLNKCSYKNIKKTVASLTNTDTVHSATGSQFGFFRKSVMSFTKGQMSSMVLYFLQLRTVQR